MKVPGVGPAEAQAPVINYGSFYAGVEACKNRATHNQPLMAR
jgi:hypothetical protein